MDSYLDRRDFVPPVYGDNEYRATTLVGHPLGWANRRGHTQFFNGVNRIADNLVVQPFRVDPEALKLMRQWLSGKL